MDQKLESESRVCVTGASGFLASWLIKRLLMSGYHVTGTVRDPGNQKKLAHLWRLEGAKERLRLVKADLVEEGSFDDAIFGCHGVFHSASPVPKLSSDPKKEILDPAIEGTLNVLRSCKKNPSLRRVVLTSSSSAVRVRDGDDFDPNIPLDESSWSSVELCQKLQPDDNGEKHVLLCRVILGNVEKVEAGSQQCYPSSMEFDTGVDDPRTPTRYVVWPTNMNRHVLPECVVSYKPSDHVPGSLPRKYHVAELISRVRNSLPPSKVQQLSNLVHGLKAGKSARNDFCRQFRLVVGEQLLRSAIPEMRGSEQAERAALDFCKANGIDLVTVLPTFVVGPSLPPDLCSTASDILGLLKGETERFKLHGRMGYVHIDDVALCHILVYEHKSAHGRYICNSTVLDNNELASLLSTRYPSIPIPERFEQLERPHYDFNTSKMRALGFKFKTVQEMFDDCIASLVEQGHLSPF